MSEVVRIESLTDSHNCCRFNFKIEQSWVEIIDNYTSDTIVSEDYDTKKDCLEQAILVFKSKKFETELIHE